MKRGRVDDTVEMTVPHRRRERIAVEDRSHHLGATARNKIEANGAMAALGKRIDEPLTEPTR